MPTTITRSPTTVGLDAGIGAGPITWQTPEHAVASDDQWAIASTPTSGTTRYLKATDFGFTIPTNATILGILVGYECARRPEGGIAPVPITVTEAVVRLLSEGIVGENRAVLGSNWPTYDTYLARGSSLDLWGEIWTPERINAAGFGVVLSVAVSLPGSYDASFYVARVDHVVISVTYETFPEPWVLEAVVVGDAVEVEDLSAPSGTVGCILDFSHWLLGLPKGFLSTAAGGFAYWLLGLPVVHFCVPLTVVDDSMAISDAVAVETDPVPPISPGGPTWAKLLIKTAWAKQEVG